MKDKIELIARYFGYICAGVIILTLIGMAIGFVEARYVWL